MKAYKILCLKILFALFCITPLMAITMIITYIMPYGGRTCIGIYGAMAFIILAKSFEYKIKTYKAN